MSSALSSVPLILPLWRVAVGGTSLDILLLPPAGSELDLVPPSAITERSLRTLTDRGELNGEEEGLTLPMNVRQQSEPGRHRKDLLLESRVKSLSPVDGS